MADSFETLFTVSDKTYTECKAGVALYSTSGSQKAVIKDIKIKNAGGKAVQLVKGNVSTGYTFAVSTASGVFSGNEIFDNSESIGMRTDINATLTSVITASTFNGMNSSYIGNSSRGYGEYNDFGKSYDPLFIPTKGLNSDGTGTYRSYVGADKGQELAEGQFAGQISSLLYDGCFQKINDYVYGFSGHMSQGYFPTGQSNNDSRKLHVLRWSAADVTSWDANNATTGYTSLNTWGGVHLFDNQRYIYVIGRESQQSGANENNIWKYDTVNRTSSELRTRNMGNTANENIYNVHKDKWSAYYLEQDGIPYAAVIPTSNTAGGTNHGTAPTTYNSMPCIINLNTGQKRHLSTTEDNTYNNNNIWSGVRRLWAGCELDDGRWIMTLGTAYTTTDSSNNNIISFFDLGTSLQNWIEGTTNIRKITRSTYNNSSTTGGDFYSSSAGNTSDGSSYSDTDHGTACIKRRGTQGQYYHSQPACQAVGIKNHIFLFNSYCGAANSGVTNKMVQMAWNMKMAIEGGQFHKFATFFGGNGNYSASSTYPASAMNGLGTRFMVDPNVVSADFGKVSVQGSGVLIT